MTTERETLREAIAARTAALAELEGTRAALRKAEELAANAELALSQHVDLDQRLAAHRGERVALWAKSGANGAPAVELSVELAAEAAERDQRLETLAAARDGVSHLTRAEASGITDLRRCEAAVVRSAEDVVLDHCAGLHARWSAAFDELSRLAVELQASAATWFVAPGLSPRPLTISPAHRSAIKVINEAAVSGLNGSMMNAGMHPFSTKIGDWWRRLTVDADAELDPPPMAKVVPISKAKAAAAALLFALAAAALPHVSFAQSQPALPVLQQSTMRQMSVPISAQDTGTVATPDATNYGDRRVGCIYTQASHTGSPAAAIAIEGRDPVSGTYFTLATSGSLTADGATELAAGAGLPNSAAIPPIWRGQLIVTTGVVTGDLYCWGQG